VHKSDVMEIERACGRLVVNFVRHIDSGDYDEAAQLFTVDGRFVRRGQVFSGHSAIAASVDEILQARRENPRQPSWRVRHVCTNMFLDVLDENRATGGSCYLIYRYTGGPVDGAAPVKGASLIGDYVDDYVRTPAGWRIARREARPVFFQSE
jgi:hypothetical protein